ncbi:unnamed protein product [Fraxinus pennsylvanica]|uniref:NB-ARC domain-containing protein n=1 Tax=Fraxinus pennsylvanica TaxID=56036 RepID=A0AAD2EBC0_9LAMI|nr:unnamed protein product [Fraxinus pennsylvanica]
MQNDFTSSALVYVSNEPRVQELLIEIAKQVGLEEEKIKENLKVNLLSLLNEKRCLIFLDDIWKVESWDELKNVIPINSRNGSRIIITSRYTDVGRYICGESSLIELKLLDQEKSWELFSELMKSSSENNERFPPIELEDIAKKIVERCGGLPLAIVVAVGERWTWIPNEIGDLSSLTFLKLSGRFERIPSTIRNLKKLVTLDIRKARFICDLPRTIFRMKHLKHLLLCHGNISESNKCTNLNVRNEVYFSNIEILHWVPGTILKARSLQKLSNLRKLGLYEINDQHINVISGKTPISEKLQDLQLWFEQKFNWLNLSHYDHLTELMLIARSNFPFKLDTIEFPPNLTYLILQNMKYTEDPMMVLKELPKLEILRLSHCTYSQSITLDFTGANSFPELQVLAVQRRFKEYVIPELIVDQIGMPKLFKFVCDQKDLNVAERLREIMVEP